MIDAMPRGLSQYALKILAATLLSLMSKGCGSPDGSGGTGGAGGAQPDCAHVVEQEATPQNSDSTVCRAKTLGTVYEAKGFVLDKNGEKVSPELVAIACAERGKDAGTAACKEASPDAVCDVALEEAVRLGGLEGVNLKDNLIYPVLETVAGIESGVLQCCAAILNAGPRGSFSSEAPLLNLNCNKSFAADESAACHEGATPEYVVGEYCEQN